MPDQVAQPIQSALRDMDNQAFLQFVSDEPAKKEPEKAEVQEKTEDSKKKTEEAKKVSVKEVKTEAEETEESEEPEEIKASKEEPEEKEEEEPEASKEESEEVKESKLPFRVFDNEGELEPPLDLKFSYKANGKEYHDVPLEKLVQLAQMGHYNHEKHIETQKIKQEHTQVTQAYQQLQQQHQQTVQRFEQYLNMLAEDPTFYEEFVREYQSINTPEAKLAKLQQEREAERQTYQRAYEDWQLSSFVKDVLAPQYEQLLKEHPTVTKHEMLGRFTELVTPLLVQGRIPLSKLQDVQHLVEHDLSTWAKQLHTERTLEASKREKEVMKSKLETTQIKKSLARAVAPRGRQSPVSKQKVEPKSAKEAFEQLFQDLE